VRAAAKLNRVQSNVTTRVRQLEQHVGARLFRREGRNIRLSAEGQKLLGYADRLLRLADEAVSEMRTGKPSGAFRLGSLESTAGRRLPPLLSRYHAMFPEVVVELATGTTGALITGMRRVAPTASASRSGSPRRTSFRTGSSSSLPTKPLSHLWRPGPALPWSLDRSSPMCGRARASASTFCRRYMHEAAHSLCGTARSRPP